MSLSLYKKKRTFSNTPEPEGKKKFSKGGLVFVIQKHAASHLHYDFRLEMEGVLKSWAVPKGPSLNPEDKRLAMMVEDHPFDYRTFEGIIPEGNYGAGTVMVWDEGTFEPLEGEDLSRVEQEKLLLKELKQGNLKIVLKGSKIKGAFALVKLRTNNDNSWLLIKKDDKYAKETDVTKKDKSVVSKRTLEQIAKDKKSDIYKSNRAAAKKDPLKKLEPAKKASSRARKPVGKKKAQSVENLLKKYDGIRKAPIPSRIKPMLTTLVDSAFDDSDWIFEVKWDGYRAIAYSKNGKVELRSRNDISFTEKYHPVTDALEELNLDAVLDGEVVAVDDGGMANFQLLQSWQKSGEGTLIYYVFDIIWLNGYDLTALTTLQRKEILAEVIPENDVVLYSDHIESKGTQFYEVARHKGLEGIIAKKKDASYEINARSRSWLKIKTTLRQEVVIGGFTEGRASRNYFGALILGVYQDGELKYAGHTGSGFNEKTLKELWSKLQPIVTDKCPFEKKPKTNMPATWVKPKLICEIKFQEWTKDGLMRQPIFTGLRTDKKPTDVKREDAMATKAAKKKAGDKTPATKTTKAKSAVKAAAKKTVSKKTAAKLPAKTTKSSKGSRATSKKNVAAELVHGGETEEIVKLNGHDLKLTNLDKLYWKKDKISKGDMINYYHRIAPYILPYLKDRPQSLNRHPNGIDGMSFYQKDVKGKVADWIEMHADFSESTNQDVHYFVCTDEASLIYVANLGCIEMNPWHSRKQTPDNPDHCLIDLDPHEIGFDKVIETAQVVKSVLDELKIPGYCKTSGASGLHIYIPLGAKYDYDQSKQLAELLVTLVHHEIPAITSLERSPAKRRRKVYLDFLQNRQGQTVAAPYSLRPKPGATVSTPLHWEEVRKGLSPTQFTMDNIFDRLKVEGDLFAPVLGKGIDLGKTLDKIESFLAVE